MPGIPEDLLTAFMKMTGLPREQAEIELNKIAQRLMSNSGHYSESLNKTDDSNIVPKYDEDNYPCFLPSEHIQKYTVRISLIHSNPVIWRKFECPSNISLRHFTELIAELMGWDNSHLNSINVGEDACYVPYYQHDPEYGLEDVLFQEEYKLSDVLFEKGKKIIWEYDFGDSWRHEVRLSSIAEYEEDEFRDIVFKSGKMACPPEDCGGINGYKELLELNEKRMSGKRLSSEEKSRLNFFGIDKNFDPEYFDKYDCIDICDSYSEPYEDDDSEFIEGTGPLELIDNKLKRSILDKFTPAYDETLSLAFRIRELEPWKILNDSDVYAVRMQDGSVVYIATMGNGGNSYDVQVYDGQESLQLYIATALYASAPIFLMMEEHKWAEYSTVMFQDYNDGVLEQYKYDVVEEWAEAHGKRIADEHGYPLLMHFRPHRMPTMVFEESEILRLKEAFEAVEWMSRTILESDDLLELGFTEYRQYATAKGGKVIPLVVKTPDGYKVERTTLPGVVSGYEVESLPETELLPLKSLPKQGSNYCRVLHAPGFFRDDIYDENHYSPLLLLLIDKKTGKASMTEVVELTDSFVKDLLRQFIAEVKKAGALPQRIIVDDLRTEAVLRDFCTRLGIILEFKRTRIPELTKLCRTMYDKNTNPYS